MISLILAIGLLGAGGVIDTAPTTGLPTSSQQSVDGILQINQRLVSQDNPGSSAFFEGDILLLRTPTSFSPDVTKWIKKDGIVSIPYVLDLSYQPNHIAIIMTAFSDLEETTCIRFVNRTNQRDYIFILPRLGCYSSIGRKGRMQVVSLSFDCLDVGKGIVLHELLHMLGFWHEHSRVDRDKYIRIIWPAIKKGYKQNFCKYDTTNMIGNYTLDSILHYSENAFANEGMKTIVPLAKAEIGQRKKLHEMDILRVNKLYCTEEFLVQVSPPEMYNCGPGNSTQSEDTHPHTTPASISTFRQKSTPNYSAIKEAAQTNSSVTQELTFNAAVGFSASPKPLNSSAIERPEFSFSAIQRPEISPSATQVTEFGPALGSFTTEEPKMVPFASSIFTLTGGPKENLIFNSVSASSPDITPNISYSSSQILGGKPLLWPATSKGIKVSFIITQSSTVQPTGSITHTSPTASFLATSSLEKEGSDLLYFHEGLENTNAIQETGHTSFILPAIKTKSTINTSLNTGMSEQNSNENVCNPGSKDEVNFPDDEKDGHLNEELLKILVKRSLLPDSRKTTVGFLNVQPRKKRVLKSLHQMFYHGRPSVGTMNIESRCGFEAGMCGWKQSTDDDLNWSPAWGSVNVYTGNMKVGGLHLSLKSHQNKHIPEQRAILVRPTTQPFSCISLWYGSRHSTMGTLNIYVISDGGKKTLLWSVGGQEHVRWTKAQIDLQQLPLYHNAQVVVEGVVDSMNANKIVIDNLYVGNCS